MKKTLKRTPKNYNGKEFPVKKVDDLLEGYLQKISPKWLQEKDEVFKAWFAIIGKRLGSFTEPISFENGVLIVKVTNQTLYSLLCTQEKPRLLREMAKKFSKTRVKNILFRIG